MTYHEPILPSSTADALLMDVARRIQLSPTKHDEAEQHYQALCAYVDRPDSPLHQKVIACYPGGSFATGTAIASRVSKDQHDVDVVIELDISPFHDPADVLKTLFAAALSHELDLPFVESHAGSHVEGTYRRRLDLMSGRFALVERAHDFTLVPWRPVLEPHAGKTVSGILRAEGISWTIGRGRGGPTIS